MKLSTFLLGAVMTLGMSTVSFAQTAAEEAPQEAATKLAYPHPVVPADAPWAGAIVVLILGMFAAAAGVGVVVRANAPQEVPVAHSHDEPPGTSHHHGPGGTVQPGPEHNLPGGHGHDAGGHH